MNLIDVINKFFGGTKDSTPAEVEALIKSYFAKGESEKVKETLKDYDGAIKSHVAKELKDATDAVAGFQTALNELKEENESLKKQFAEVLGKEFAPEGDAFEGKKGEGIDPVYIDADGTFDLEKFHAKKFGN